VAGGRIMPPKEYAPQLVRRMNPRQYGGRMAPQMAQRTAPVEYGGFPQPQVAQRTYSNPFGPAPQPASQPMSHQVSRSAPPMPQMARNGDRREFEGAVEYLGTTDRIVEPGESTSQMAHRGSPAPRGELQPEPVRQQSQVRQAQARRPIDR